MFFMSKKRFEEEVFRRLDKEREALYMNQRMSDMDNAHYRNIEKIEHRLVRLEEAVFKKQPECPAERVVRC